MILRLEKSAPLTIENWFSAPSGPVTCVGLKKDDDGTQKLYYGVTLNGDEGTLFKVNADDDATGLIEVATFNGTCKYFQGYDEIAVWSTDEGDLFRYDTNGPVSGSAVKMPTPGYLVDSFLLTSGNLLLYGTGDIVAPSFAIKSMRSQNLEVALGIDTESELDDKFFFNFEGMGLPPAENGAWAGMMNMNTVSWSSLNTNFLFQNSSGSLFGFFSPFVSNPVQFPTSAANETNSPRRFIPTYFFDILNAFFDADVSLEPDQDPFLYFGLGGIVTDHALLQTLPSLILLISCIFLVL